MASASKPGDTMIAKEMIEHLDRLSKAMDEYFEIPSITMMDGSGAGREIPEQIPEQLRPGRQV